MRGIILCFCFTLFAFCVLANVARNPLDAPDTQIDEQAHLSYAFTLIAQDRWWPDYTHFPMVNRTTQQPLTDVNYLNHPPTFYWLAKLLTHVTTVDGTVLRYVSLALTLAAMALYARIGQRLALPAMGTLLYAMLPFLIFMHLQVGFYNNDAAAILGGMLVVRASLSWFRGERIPQAFWLVMLGLALASVKLTAFMLVALYALCCLMLRRPQLRQLKMHHWLAACLIGAALLAPYVMLFLQTGSLAPETLGQQLVMAHHPAEGWSRVPILGWVPQERMEFLPWLLTFLRNFVNQVAGFDPSIVALGLIFLGFIASARQRAETPLQQIMLACCATSAMMLLVHIAFSWPRYHRYGWLLDSGLRYYFPLLAAYGAVCAGGIGQWGRMKGTAS